jgi:hypothetical protein
LHKEKKTTKNSVPEDHLQSRGHENGVAIVNRTTQDLPHEGTVLFPVPNFATKRFLECTKKKIITYTSLAITCFVKRLHYFHIVTWK